MAIFDCIRSRTSGGKSSSIILDDCSLRFYHRFTSIVFLLLALTITMREWSIDAIDCSVPYHSTDVDEEKIQLLSSYHFNTYCKLHERFLPVEMQCIQQDGSESNYSIIQEMLELLNHKNRKLSSKDTVPKYQWFSLIFLLFALGFQIPYQIWRCSTQSLVTSTISKINNEHLSIEEKIRKSLISSVGCILTLTHILVKFFNLLLLCSMVAIMEHLTNDRFVFLPVFIWKKLFRTDQEQCQGIVTETEDLFPKASFCPYVYMDASTGGGKWRTMWVQCLMPINTLLEQVCLFLWLWTAILALVSLVDLLHNFILICCRCQRLATLKYRTNCQWSPNTYNRACRSYSSWLLTNLIWINNANSIQSTNQQEMENSHVMALSPMGYSQIPNSGAESPETSTTIV